LNSAQNRHRLRVLERLRNSAVRTEDPFSDTGDEGAQRHAVEHAVEQLPHRFRESAVFEVLSKAVLRVDHSRLMVAAQQVDPFFVDALQRQKQDDRLDRVPAAVHIVAEEQVFRLGVIEPMVFGEDHFQVLELAVDVSNNDHRRHDHVCSKRKKV